MENLKTKENELRSLIFQRSNKQPEEIEVNHKVNDQKFDSYEKIKEYLKKLSFQREQIGPVNLRAEIEEKEIQTMIEDLQLEKNDLVDALQKLREAINKLIMKAKTDF